MLELVQRDDEFNPPKGLIAARELASADVVAVFGGIDTPVSLAMVPLAQQGEAHLHGRVGRGPASRATAPLPTTPFASRRWMPWSTCGCSPCTRNSRRRRPGSCSSTIPGASRMKKGLVAASKAVSSIEIAGIEKFENNDVDLRSRCSQMSCLTSPRFVVNAIECFVYRLLKRLHTMDH